MYNSSELGKEEDPNLILKLSEFIVMVKKKTTKLSEYY
jgi:hypothetical protein